MDRYEGNLSYLKNIVVLIKEIYQNKVSEFLREEDIILTEDIKSQLTELYNRLSPIEKQIILQLSEFNQPLSREDLRERLSLSSTDLINGLQSLSRRYLLKTIETNKLLFSFSPIFRKYVMFKSSD